MKRIRECIETPIGIRWVSGDTRKEVDERKRAIGLAPNKRTTGKCGIIAPTQKEAAKDGTEE